MATIGEIEYKLESAKRELNRLKGSREVVSRDESARLGDGLTYVENRSNGTKEQIALAQEKVERLEKELKEAIEWEKNKPLREAQDRKAAELSKKEEEKQKERDKVNNEREKKLKESAFRKVKERYKSVSLGERFLNKINGKAPNWKKVRELSREELEYLSRVTADNKQDYISSHDKKRRQDRQNRNVEKMRRLMKNNLRLQEEMEREKQGGYGRKY